LEVHGIRSKLVSPGDSVVEKFVESLRAANLRLRNGDIVAIASKIVSVSEGNIVDLSRVRLTKPGRSLARRFRFPAELAQTIINESDAVYGGVSGAVLTLKDGNAVANAGVDQKNAPRNHVVPWPSNPDRSADAIRKALFKRLKKNVGIVIVDSRVTPLRLGTTGLAIACSGFQPVWDARGLKDLFGRTVVMTLQSVADEIAAASHLLMGETQEAVPFVLVRGAPVKIESGKRFLPMTLPQEKCLYMSQISQPVLKLERNLGHMT